MSMRSSFASVGITNKRVREKQVPPPRGAQERTSGVGMTIVARFAPVAMKSAVRAASVGMTIVALVTLFCASGARGQALHLQPHERVVLKNGLTLLLMEKH